MPNEESTSSTSGQYLRADASIGGQQGISGSAIGGVARQWSSMFTLVLASMAGSIVIVLYVMWVNSMTVHRKGVNIFDEAALVASHDLSKISVEYPSFGRVGLCDLEGSRGSPGSPRVVGLNSLKSTLKVDRKIAEELQQPVIMRLVQLDEAVCTRVEHDLTEKLRLAVQPDVAQASLSPTGKPTEDQDNSVYTRVHHLISADRSTQLANPGSVKIFLGHAKSPEILKDLTEPTLLAEQNFVADDHSAPNLVLIEAACEQRAQGKIKLVTRRSCVSLPAKVVPPKPAALVFTFPDGIPPLFHSAYDFLTYKNWKGKGNWQQALGSQVPGKGNLSPPVEPILPTMPPGDAMAVTLYHWLRSAGPDVSPPRLIALLKSRWPTEQLLATASGATDVQSHGERVLCPVNTCLARDTGAREYSIMNQSGPHCTGQNALGKAFNIAGSQNASPGQRDYPPSALPLFVDKNGVCNLAGRHGFDSKLVHDFLHAVYRTNLAAIETSSSAEIMMKQSNVLMAQINNKIKFETEELQSIQNRLDRPDLDLSAAVPKSRLIPALPPNEPAEDLSKLVKERIETLKRTVEEDKEQRHKYAIMNILAATAHTNASKVVSATYDLCAHTFNNCREGIYRIQKPLPAFLIKACNQRESGLPRRKQFVFLPCQTPLSESDLFQIVMQSKKQPPVETSEAERDPRLYWLLPNLDVVPTPEVAFPDNQSVTTDDGKSLQEILTEAPYCEPNPAGMIVLDARNLSTSVPEEPTTLASPEYAFPNIPIPSGQLLYYCQDAVQTGTDLKVNWSVLVRDLVASRGGGNNSEGTLGEPVSASRHDWCKKAKKADAFECPGLACEIQVRCPIPVLSTFPENLDISNGNINTVRKPQIPPVPADML